MIDTRVSAWTVAETVWQLGVVDAMEAFDVDRAGVLAACWFVTQYRRRGGRETAEQRRMVRAFTDWSDANVHALWAGGEADDPPIRTCRR